MGGVGGGRACVSGVLYIERGGSSNVGYNCSARSITPGFPSAGFRTGPGILGSDMTQRLPLQSEKSAGIPGRLLSSDLNISSSHLNPYVVCSVRFKVLGQSTSELGFSEGTSEGMSDAQ